MPGEQDSTAFDKMVNCGDSEMDFREGWTGQLGCFEDVVFLDHVCHLPGPVLGFLQSLPHVFLVTTICGGHRPFTFHS